MSLNVVVQSEAVGPVRLGRYVERMVRSQRAILVYFSCLVTLVSWRRVKGGGTW